MKNFAYSLLEIKAVSDDQRIISGIATTPVADRTGDIVDPEGAQFELPIPLLWQHDSSQPIGEVFEATVTPKGIEIKARIANVPEPGRLKDRLDEAWLAVKHKLVKGFSIGFKELESAAIAGTRGVRFTKWMWLELSAVTIPANAQASILSIKSIDQEQRAASGTASKVVRLKTQPGVSGPLNITPKGPEVKTLAEQLASFEAKRAADAARMGAIMTKAGDEGRTLDDAEAQEYDDLDRELKSVDQHIVRLKAHEASVVSTATPVSRSVVVDQKSASTVRGGSSLEIPGNIISVRPNVEKGIAFTRYVKALAMSRGNLPGALAIAEHNKSWSETTPVVAEVLKAAVAAGDTTTTGWASQLVYSQNLAGEFIELLRPMTVIGKLQGMTRVPFNVRMGGQDQGSTAYWVGEGKPVPVSKLNFLEVTLGIAKAAGLIVLTEELVRSSEPSAELLVRNDLTRSIASFLDVQFLDPNFAAVANVSPASITNGVTPLTPTGTTSAFLRADVQTLFAGYINDNVDLTGAVWIMSPTRALAIGLMLNALGQPVFPGMGLNGGTFMGIPVIVSNSANIAGSPASGDMIILVNAPDILFADDGQVTIDASREASIEMLDNPTNNSDAVPTHTTMVSMFQTNSVAIKAVRFVNWKKRRSNAVAFIRDGAYVT